MAKFNVEVKKTFEKTWEFELEADTEEEAQQEALRRSVKAEPIDENFIDYDTSTVPLDED